MFPCLPDRLLTLFLADMLKIPTFVLGGLLIITGLFGYLFQDPGLSLTITGSLDDDVELKLSDGEQTASIHFQPGNDLSGGQQVFDIIKFSPGDYELPSFGGGEQLNTKAERQSRTNLVKSNSNGKTSSYWMATSKDEPLQALLDQDFSADLKGLTKSKLRLVYVNDGDEPGPVELTVSKWKGIEGNYENGASLSFAKSPTALIPALLGLLLIGLVKGSEASPKLSKHLMHAAAAIALLSFGYLASKIPAIWQETSWFRDDAVIHISFLKPIIFIFSAGLLFIFVILCVLSFVNARKEMAARPKPKKEEKKKEEDFEDDEDEDDFEDDKKEKPGKDSSKAKGTKMDKEDGGDRKKEIKSPAKPLGHDPKSGEGKLKNSKSTGSPFGEKKKAAPSGKPKSIDSEKARRPKSIEGQRDGIPKTPEKAKAFEQRSDESKRDDKAEAVKSSTSEDSKPRKSEKNSTNEADSEKKPEPQEPEKAKPFEQRSDESKRDDKPEAVKSSTPEDSKPRESKKTSTTAVDSEKKPEPKEPKDSKPDVGSASDSKKDAGKSEGDERQESSEKKID